MKAAILVESNQPLVVEEVEEPRELTFGQVRVKLCYSGVCGAQINEIDAIKGPDRFLPHLLGHEGSGIVMETGPGVQQVKEGDHVVLHWRPSNGIQAAPAQYKWNGKGVNSGWVTTFNERAVVSENRVTPIPKGFDLKLAPLFGCAITTAMGVINNDAAVRIGQSVVVFGVGGVGLNIVQAAEMVSGYPIVAVDIKENKLSMALKFGASHVLNSTQENNIIGKVKSILGEKGADVVIDTTGIASVIESAYTLTQPDGKTILVGVPKKGDNVSIYTLPLHFKKQLRGSHGGGSNPHIDIPRYIRLCEKGKMRLDGLITHEYDLDNINKAIEILRSGKAGRIIIKCVGT